MHYVHSASLAYEDGSVFMSGPFAEWLLGNGYHLLVLMPHEQTHGAFSILKQIGILSPDGTKARAVKNVMKLIANSLSVAKVAPTEMAGEAGLNKPALLNRQRI